MSRLFWHRVWTGFFILLTVVGLFSGQVLVIAFAVMGLVAGVIAWAWNELSLEEVSYERKLSLSRLFVGDELSVALTLVNKKPVPLSWLRAADDLHPDLRVISGDDRANVYPNGPAFIHSTSMAWYESVRWSYRVRCMRRGLYRLGPARLQSGDPFGFLRSERREAGPDEVLVYPRVVPLEELGIPPIQPLGEAIGGMEMFRDPARPSGIRDYQVGDPLKIVDWKTTARAQRLEVRTYEPSSATSVILVVAIDTTEPYWAAYSLDELERVVVAAASVAQYASEREYSLGLFANDTPARIQRPLNVPPGRGPDQYGLVLEALAKIREYATAPMSAHLAEHVRRFPLGSTLVIVTAFLPRDLANVIKDAKRLGHKMVVLYAGAETVPDVGEGVILYRVRKHLDEMEALGAILEK